MINKKKYDTTVSVSNITRNKIIALTSIYHTTQKKLLEMLIDNEIKHLATEDKSNFEYLLQVVKIKDSFKQNKTGDLKCKTK